MKRFLLALSLLGLLSAPALADCGCRCRCLRTWQPYYGSYGYRFDYPTYYGGYGFGQGLYGGYGRFYTPGFIGRARFAPQPIGLFR
jgi:hypothetical protein